MSKITHSRRTGFPRLCASCSQPFPVRAGHAEALLGEDGRLYCHAGPAACAEHAVGVRKAA